MAKRRRARNRALVGVLVVLILAGVAGTIFYLDYHQARTNSKEKKVDVAKQRAAAGFQLAGHVSAVTADSVTVKLANGHLRRLVLAPQTRVQSSGPGTLDDVKKGLRAVVRKKQGAVLSVQEILVLPRASRVGQMVLDTGLGFVWLVGNDGRTGPRLNMVQATVVTAHSAARTDVVVGAKVLVRGQTTVAKPVRTIATDIVLLPSSTTLVS
ncbi:MAG: hypothetical protein QOF59_1440 [Actinomycetota bacterium]|nr:hypothetical protein [Actinomycetota bacterium]